MTLEESLQETEEFAKGYVQSVPKVVGETVQDMIELPPAIMELPDTIYAMWQLIEEYGAETVASGILESTKERIETAWNEEVVNGTARSRGEIAGRVVLVASEVVLSVNGLAKGKR